MKTLIIFVSLCALATLAHCNPQNGRRKPLRARTVEELGKFKSWRTKFQKKYKSQAEENEAIEKMLANKEKIDAHNKLEEQGKETFRRGLWKFSDLSLEEKDKLLNGVVVPPETRSAPAPPELPQFPVGPSSVDWGKKGLVGPVVEQGL